MPRVFPPAPDLPEDGGAERAVWEALRDQLPDDAALFARVALLNGATEHEIDLVVAWPGVGLAAIEVKGGHITRADGAWYQGSGDRRHTIDPVRQVQSARHALTAFLARSGASGAAHARTAHLVALAHTDVPACWETPDAPRALLIGRDDLPDIAARVRRAVEDHGQGHAP